MRLRYHELVGKHVVTADGVDAGRVADLEAKPIDGGLRVTALLVGPTALFRRIARRVPVRKVPWRLVRRVGERIEIRATAAGLAELPEDEDG